jgi:hypothetical protein
VAAQEAMAEAVIHSQEEVRVPASTSQTFSINSGVERVAANLSSNSKAANNLDLNKRHRLNAAQILRLVSTSTSNKPCPAPKSNLAIFVYASVNAVKGPHSIRARLAHNVRARVLNHVPQQLPSAFQQALNMANNCASKRWDTNIRKEKPATF